jgi:phage terminase small subunit
MNFEQQQLPRCFFPLTTPQARREYKLVGRTLAEAGRLTLAAHRALSSFCLQLDVVFKAISEGKHVRAHQFATMDKARAQLKLEELETLRPVQVNPTRQLLRTSLRGAALCIVAGLR